MALEQSDFTEKFQFRASYTEAETKKTPDRILYTLYVYMCSSSVEALSVCKFSQTRRLRYPALSAHRAIQASISSRLSRAGSFREGLGVDVRGGLPGACHGQGAGGPPWRGVRPTVSGGAVTRTDAFASKYMCCMYTIHKCTIISIPHSFTLMNVDCVLFPGVLE